MGRVTNLPREPLARFRRWRAGSCPPRLRLAADFPSPSRFGYTSGRAAEVVEGATVRSYVTEAHHDHPRPHPQRHRHRFFCWLLFTLAVYALPFFVGLTAGMAAYHSGAGVIGALIVGSSPARSPWARPGRIRAVRSPSPRRDRRCSLPFRRRSPAIMPPSVFRNRRAVAGLARGFRRSARCSSAARLGCACCFRRPCRCGRAEHRGTASAGADGRDQKGVSMRPRRRLRLRTIGTCGICRSSREPCGPRRPARFASVGPHLWRPA